MPTARLPRLFNWVSYDDFEEGVVAEAMQQLWAQSHEGVVLWAHLSVSIWNMSAPARRSSEGVQLSIPTGTRRLLIQTGMAGSFSVCVPRAQALDVYRQTIAAGALDRASFPVERFCSSLKVIAISKSRSPGRGTWRRHTAHWDGAMASIS